MTTSASGLGDDALRKDVATLNAKDHTHFGQAISNQDAADWMAAKVPRFECPDKDMEEIKPLQPRPSGLLPPVPAKAISLAPA